MSEAGDHLGAAVSTAARVAAAGHGGQVLANEAVLMAAQAAGVDLGLHHCGTWGAAAAVSVGRG